MHIRSVLHKVCRLLKELKKYDGIIVPGGFGKRGIEGKILAIGNGEKVSKLGLVVGQKIIFGQYAGDEVKVDNKEYKNIKNQMKDIVEKMRGLAENMLEEGILLLVPEQHHLKTKRVIDDSKRLLKRYFIGIFFGKINKIIPVIR